ncbi:MAG: aminoglycoside 6-adenylyltransferase [Caldilineaceae bacterium]
MKMTIDPYEQLMNDFTTWAEREPNLHTALVIGSQVRPDHPADQWSDLDLIIIAQNPQQFIADDAWVAQVGDPVFTFVERTVSGDPERRVLFQGGEYGLEVDFTFLSVEKVKGLLHAPQLSPELADALFNAFGRGMRVLVDKDHLAESIQKLLAPMQRPTPSLPSPDAYQTVVSDFWYHALWTAKHLCRGELWWAKSGCDMRLKQLLLTMMEWHAHCTAEPSNDTWFRGRFLETWVDPHTRCELEHVFAHYDEADIWRALLATMKLFRWAALDTAQRLEYTYPTEGDDYVTRLVEQLHEGVGELFVLI